jgi:hypothetical protein
MNKNCALCGCQLNRSGEYGTPTVQGRAHASEHHFVAERFFGRSKNRPGTQRERIFSECPWGQEGQSGIFCYECGEELFHNPVFLPKDIQNLAALVRLRGLNEEQKPDDREKMAGRVQLLHEVIEAGLKHIGEQNNACDVSNCTAHDD